MKLILIIWIRDKIIQLFFLRYLSFYNNKNSTVVLCIKYQFYRDSKFYFLV